LNRRTARRSVPLSTAAALIAGLTILLATLPARGESVAPRIASYRIEARLDPHTHEVRGEEVLEWHNATAEATPDLCLHLYLNAFANNRTTLLEDLPEETARWMRRHPGGWGGIDVTSIRVGGADLTDRLQFERPSDGNPNDRTLARLPLPAKVAPGHDVEVEMRFTAHLPRLFLRSGHAAPFFFVAQWFPKVGVFEDGKWQCHQYHATGEFYADFGTYDVDLTVPSEYVLGYTGVKQSERDNGDGTKTVAVRAEDVHDFAWAADPRFQVVEEKIEGAQVRLLLQPQHRRQAERILGALRAAMTRYADWLGPYPYPVLTIVDAGAGGEAASAMEYPMLMTIDTKWWMPSGIRLPELLTVHEFGHQYWYGLVANDEVRYPWLDEGINSYFEGLVMDAAYGEGHSYVDFLGLRLGSVGVQRLRYLGAARYDPIVTSAEDVLDQRSYVSIAYAKTALTLQTLAHQVGAERLRTALRDYFRAWRFRHPKGSDFRRAMEASLGKDVHSFFAQTLDGTGLLDYAIARLDVREIPPLAGRDVESGLEAQPTRYRAEIVVERRGQVHMPVDILVMFADRSATRQVWDGKERWHRIEIVSTSQPDYAVVDPDEKLPLDVDRINNSRLRIPGTRGIIRLAGHWALWFQGLLQVLTGL
jgi:Peptidase family M1 domain